MMDNFNFLQRYMQLQQTIMFDQLIDLKYALVGYSTIDPSPFWNNALTNQILQDKHLEEIKSCLLKLKRKPTIYFEKSAELVTLESKLKEHRYNKHFEDTWQFWNNNKIDETHFIKVKKVSTIEDLNIFLTLFDNCFQKNDPQNPYGELGEYLITAKNSWIKHHETNRIEYFMVFNDDTPVAVSTLTNHNGLGYISNVGSLKSFRGKGYGKAATLYCVKQSIENGNSEHCLATEEGHYPHSFYERVGFRPRFNAVAYTLE